MDGLYEIYLSLVLALLFSTPKSSSPSVNFAPDANVLLE